MKWKEFLRHFMFGFSRSLYCLCSVDVSNKPVLNVKYPNWSTRVLPISVFCRIAHSSLIVYLPSALKSILNMLHYQLIQYIVELESTNLGVNSY